MNALLEEFTGSPVPPSAQKDGVESPIAISRSIERTAKDDANVVVVQSSGEECGVEQLKNLAEV